MDKPHPWFLASILWKKIVAYTWTFMVFRFKVETKVKTVVPAVKLGCFVVHLGDLKTLPKQGYVIGLFAILYCYVRSLIGQFVINGSAAVSSFSGFVLRHWYFGPAVCLFDAKIDANLPNRYNLSSNIVSGKQGEEVWWVCLESRREGIDVLFIVLVVEVATRIQGPDLMFVQKLKYSK